MANKRIIPLREAETVALMRAARGRSLHLAFGTGGAALKPELSPWALPLLRAMREVVLVDGAGI